jgi:hypothetical protein
MNVKVMLSLIGSMLVASFVLAHGVQAIDELEANGGLPIQTSTFANGAKAFLFLSMAFLSALTTMGVRRLVKNRN